MMEEEEEEEEGVLVHLLVPQTFSCIEKIKSTGATYMAASGLGGGSTLHNHLLWIGQQIAISNRARADPGLGLARPWALPRDPGHGPWSQALGPGLRPWALGPNPGLQSRAKAQGPHPGPAWSWMTQGSQAFRPWPWV